jgi:MFS superfamily sulfate permease-like transporter
MPHRRGARHLVGAICLLGRLARLGFLADMLSRPVLVGYLTGIALIMIAGQLENVTGVPVEGGAFLADIASFAGHIELVHGPTLGMSTTVLAFLIVVGTLLPRIPGATGGRVAGRSGERAARTGPGRHARGRTGPRGTAGARSSGHHARRHRASAPGGTRRPFRYDAPLCFANAENLRNRALAVLDVEPATRWLLLNMEAVIEIDLTAADAVHSAA